MSEYFGERVNMAAEIHLMGSSSEEEIGRTVRPREDFWLIFLFTFCLNIHLLKNIFTRFYLITYT
jgi:hypothetical protein